MLLLRFLVLALLSLSAAVQAQSGPPLTRIAFGSCADEEKPQPIWDAVLAYRPELFLFTGDNVYGDVRNGRNVPLKITDQRGAPGRERYLPDEDPTKSMLGEAQWAWLAERLREPAEVRLIVSSVQVVAEGHGCERWGNFPKERQRLYDLVRDTRANGVIFLRNGTLLDYPAIKVQKRLLR